MEFEEFVKALKTAHRNYPMRYVLGPEAQAEDECQAVRFEGEVAGSHHCMCPITAVAFDVDGGEKLLVGMDRGQKMEALDGYEPCWAVDRATDLGMTGTLASEVMEIADKRPEEEAPARLRAMRKTLEDVVEATPA